MRASFLVIFGAFGCATAMAPRSANARPTDAQGAYAFDPTDVVESWDEPSGAVRVHFSVSGPSATRLADTDLDGVPDFAQLAATTAAQALSTYAAMGFAPPVAESEFALGDLGGSAAFDMYLVDFAGNADGRFGIDDCRGTPARCAGYIAMENDFAGYGYESLPVAVDVLTSHELFHAVQAAYNSELPTWVSEGTATWAEQQFAPPSADFLGFCDAYLADTERSLSRPPTGPVPAFAYGTALWFDFLTLYASPTVVREFLEAAATLAPGDAQAEAFELAVLRDVVGGANELATLWHVFVTWNLATGARSGGMETYPYAAALRQVSATAQAPVIDQALRFYPLAAHYVLLEHAGGPMYFAADQAAPNVWFALHPTATGSTSGAVLPAVTTWHSHDDQAHALADGQDFAAGAYWVIGANSDAASSAVKLRLCIGDRATAAACATAAPEAEPSGSGCNAASRVPSQPWRHDLTVLAMWLTLILTGGWLRRRIHAVDATNAPR